MNQEKLVMLRRQGSYIRHLREGQQFSIRAFADRLDIPESLLKAIEQGEEEAPDKVIKGLPSISEAWEIDIQRVFGERWQKAKERGAETI